MAAMGVVVAVGAGPWVPASVTDEYVRGDPTGEELVEAVDAEGSDIIHPIEAPRN